MSRRTVRIRLDAKVDRPWLRNPEDFRHPSLLEWVKQHRGELIWSALVLVQNWIAKGCPEPKGVPTLGMFERWSCVIGGILQSAGIRGFLGNLEDFYEQADSEGAELRRFVETWHRNHRLEAVGVKELYRLVTEYQIDLGLRGESDIARKTSLGRLMNTLRDRLFGNFRISYAGDRKGAQLWNLVPTHVREVEAPRPSHENKATSNSSDFSKTETGYI